MKLFELFATLGLDTGDFDKGIDGAQGKISSLAQNMGKAASSVGKTVYNAASGIVNTMDKAVKTVVTAGGTAMVAFGTQAVKAAADIAAENAQFEASFGDLADEATAAYGEIAKETNILSTRLQTTGTKGFSQLKGAGLSANDALEASARLLNLAADGAAYYDMSLEDTDERLRSFLRGNVEAGDAIGLFTSELQRNNKAVELYGKKWTELTEAQKQMTMLDIAEGIYKASGAAGQAARESEGWANVMANLSESWRQVLGVVGTPIVDAITPVIQGITSYMVENKDKLSDFATSLGEIITLLTTGHEAEGITAASGLIGNFLTQIDGALKEGSIKQKGKEIFNALRDGFQENIRNLAPVIGELAGQIAPMLVTYNADLLAAGLNLITGIADGIRNNKGELASAIEEGITGISDWISGGGAMTLLTAGLEIAGAIGSGITRGFAEILGLGELLYGTDRFEAEEENPLYKSIFNSRMELKRFQESLDETEKTYAGFVEDAQTRYELAQKHLETVDKVNAKENKSAQDMAALKEAMTALQLLYPELNAYIDSDTGAFTSNTAAIRANIDALNELSIANAQKYIRQEYEEDYAIAAKNYISASKEEATAEQNLKGYADRYEELSRVYSTFYDEQGIIQGAREYYGTMDGLVLQSIKGMEDYYDFLQDGSATLKAEFKNSYGEIATYAKADIAELLYGEILGIETAVTKASNELENAKQTTQTYADDMARIAEQYAGDVEILANMGKETMADTSGWTKETAEAFVGASETLQMFGEVSAETMAKYEEAKAFLESEFDTSAIEEATEKATEASETIGEAEEKATEAAETIGEAVQTAAQEVDAAATEMAGTTESASSSIASAFQQIKDAASGTGSAVSEALSTTPNTSGVTSAASAVISALAAVAAQAAITSAAVSAAFAASGPTSFQTAGKYARGLEYVPYDDYPALLHKGEKVLTAQEAEDFREGKGQERNQVTVYQNIQAVPMTPSELAFQTSVALEMLRFSA